MGQLFGKWENIFLKIDHGTQSKQNRRADRLVATVNLSETWVIS